MTKPPEAPDADTATFRDVTAVLDGIRVHPQPRDVLSDVRARVTRRRRHRVVAASVCAAAACIGIGAAATAVASHDGRSDGDDVVATDPSGSGEPSAATSSPPAGEATCPLSTLGKDTTATVSLPCAVGAELLDVTPLYGQGATCAQVTYRVDATSPVAEARVCAGDTRSDGLVIAED